MPEKLSGTKTKFLHCERREPLFVRITKSHQLLAGLPALIAGLAIVTYTLTGLIVNTIHPAETIYVSDDQHNYTSV